MELKGTCWLNVQCMDGEKKLIVRIRINNKLNQCKMLSLPRIPTPDIAIIPALSVKCWQVLHIRNTVRESSEYNHSPNPHSPPHPIPKKPLNLPPKKTLKKG